MGSAMRQPAKPETRGAGRMLDDPKPGFFKTRLVRNGPFVTAELRHGTDHEAPDRSPLWETYINGKLIEHPSPDPVRAGVFRVWTSIPISAAEYEEMTNAKNGARPVDPISTPERRASVKRLPPEYFKLAPRS